MSNFYLCDYCGVYHRKTDYLCDLTVGLTEEKKVMIDRGYSQGYDEPSNVCENYIPARSRTRA